jgi:hypothetical protein
MYHAAIAIGHFARRLRAESPGARNEYQVVAVLQALWLRAPDMLTETPRVVVGFDDLAGIVEARPRFRQIIARLKAIGALTRAEVGYVLFKPTVEHLDEQARAQVETAWQLGGGTKRTKKPPESAEPGDAAQPQRERDDDKQDAQVRRRETLARLGKQPSDIRDVLAWLAGKQPDSMRYSGKGSGATQETIEWFTNTGAGWQDFGRVCKAVKLDKSPDKPAEIEWLFAPRNADYLNRLLAQVPS